ncbi:MAG: hypothetical protein AAFP79_05070 [Pseudomonadota bacterium]
MAAAQVERVTIRLGSAVSLAELTAWFDSAQVGEVAVYASGFTLPREHESVTRAREWESKGWVHLTSRRDPADKRLWLYEVHKGSKGASTKPSAKAVPQLLGEQARCLLKLLRKIAAAGDPCPSYAELAKHLALRPDNAGRRRARYALNHLEKQKRISIEPGSSTRPIVITILAAGRAKGLSTGAGSSLEVS